MVYAATNIVLTENSFTPIDVAQWLLRSGADPNHLYQWKGE